MLFGAVAGLCAAELRPVVGIGATRDEVLAAYGWPSGQSQSGGKEIFTYPQGQVVLQDGVVEKMDFSPNVAWPNPKPRPPPPTASTAPAKPPPPSMIAAPGDAWLTDYSEARREAQRRAVDILALFTGTDWSPPCKKFELEVARQPEFLKAVGEDFVLLRLDFLTHTELPAELREQNTGLREHFAVTSYPTLLMLTADGREISRVNLAKTRAESTYVGQVIAAVEEAKPKPAPLTMWKSQPAPAAETKTVLADYSPWLLGGAAVVLLSCWWLLRHRPQGGKPGPAPQASFFPSPADIATWPQERVRDVAARLFEFEGSRVQIRPTESGAELALFAAGNERPKALVRCQAAAAGLANGRAVKLLFGTTVAEGVEGTWYLSPGGFTPDARQFAGEHAIVLIGGEDLLQRLKGVPPLALIRILGP
ncbi:MAG TPA: thioredoxin family protein [Opitutus sp.]|nr:thioredoxin family protein [Opitutus sp.]